MKSSIISLILGLTISISAFCQPESYFGYKFGDKFSREDIIKAVGNAGTFSPESDSTDLGYGFAHKVHAFTSANFLGVEYQCIIIITLDDGTFFSFSAQHIADDNNTPEKLDSIFNNTKDRYRELYQPINDNHLVSGDNECYTYFSGDLLVVLMKTFQDGATKVVQTIYSDLGVLNSVPGLANKEQIVQDTFMGIKFGDKVTVESLKAAMKDRGTYLESRSEGNHKETIFTDAYFAGQKWTFCSFSYNKDGEFYFFQAYNSVPDGYSDNDERRVASETYQSLKDKLESKYSKGLENQEENCISTMITGDNLVTVIVYNERSKSIGGNYMRFYGLKYFDYTLYKKVTDASNDEL